MLQEDDKICALCQWNKSSQNNFFCGHSNQENQSLKNSIYYNDTCELFEEREERKTLYAYLDRPESKNG